MLANFVSGVYVGDETLPVTVRVRDRRGLLEALVEGYPPVSLTLKQGRCFTIDELLLPHATIEFHGRASADTATVYQGGEVLARLSRTAPSASR